MSVILRQSNFIILTTDNYKFTALFSQNYSMVINFHCMLYYFVLCKTLFLPLLKQPHKLTMFIDHIKKHTAVNLILVNVT